MQYAISALHLGAASGGDRVPGPPSRRGRAVCAPGCARPMRFKASRPTASLEAPPAPEAPPLGMPLPGLPDDDGLDPLLPLLPEALELLDPELPLLEFGELDPLAPPELGDEAPELEGEEGGEEE